MAPLEIVGPPLRRSEDPLDGGSINPTFVLSWLYSISRVSVKLGYRALKALSSSSQHAAPQHLGQRHARLKGGVAITIG